MSLMSPLQEKLNRLVLTAFIDPETNKFHIMSPEELQALSSYARTYYFIELARREQFEKNTLPAYTEWYEKTIKKQK